MPRPICVPCCSEMRPEKNDVRVQVSDEVWSADLWMCPHCRTRIVTGYGVRPLRYYGDPLSADDRDALLLTTRDTPL